MTVSDDDGGSDVETLSKVVLDTGDCTQAQGFWRHQFSGNGNQHFDDATLGAYLDIVEFASGVFNAPCSKYLELKNPNLCQRRVIAA